MGSEMCIRDSKSAVASSDYYYLPDGIRERLTGLESRVLLAPNKPVPKDIYERLKVLEDRVRYLEGISPEYMDILEVKREISDDNDNNLPAQEQMKVKTEEQSEDISKSLSGINTRIQELQASLKAKSDSD